MGFWKWLFSTKGAAADTSVTCKELFEAAQELQIRELCFWTCVNMIASAMGRCEFKTYKKFVEVQDDEYWLWNYEPNVNENSTMFMHNMIAKLYTRNEVLMVNTRRRNGKEAIVLADDWEKPKSYPSKQNEYRQVRVGEVTYDKTFRENEVLHLKLHSRDIKPVLDNLYQSYYRLYDAATRAYRWAQGQHWKVHVGQIAQGADGWQDSFAAMIKSQVKPFLDSDGAVLPEFEGYQYENMGGTGAKVEDSRDIRELVEDIYDFTARGFQIPIVLTKGKVEGVGDARGRFMTGVIDPLCDQLQEEISRKRYGYEQWKMGTYLRVDSSAIQHFDLFANAASIEKLVGSGAYTINDIRKAANQATINEDWANEHWMTLNIARMGEAARPLGNQEGG